MALKKVLNKDIKKSITGSFGRFFSIMSLMALGSFALIGLSITGSDMRETGVHYFEKYSTADLTIISDYGLSQTEIDAISEEKGVKEIEYSYLKDVLLENTNDSYRILSNSENISKFELVSGRMPKETNEIALDSTNSKKYKIGDTITFDEERDLSFSYVLKEHTFTIVGFINSTDILSTLSRGNTTIGTGSLNYYAVVDKEVFDSDVYMMAKLIFDDTYGLNPYSEEYNDKILVHKNSLEELLNNKKDVRFSLIKSEYQSKISEATDKINDAKNELANAEDSLENAKSKIDSAKKEIKLNEKKLSDSKKQLDSARKELGKNMSELNSKKDELSNSKVKLDEALASINEASKGLESAKSTLDSSLTMLNLKQDELDAKKKELNDNYKLLDQKTNELKTNQNNLNEAKKKYEDSISELNSQIEKLNLILSRSDLTIEEREQYNNQLNILETQLSTLNSEYNKFLNETYNPGIKSINDGFAQIEINRSKLNESSVMLDSLSKELEKSFVEYNLKYNEYLKSYNELEEYKKEYNKNIKDYNDALDKISDAESKLMLAENELNKNTTKYNSALKTLNDAKRELASKEKEYYKKLDEYNEKSKEALEEISDGEEDLEEAKKDFNNLTSPVYSVNNRREVPGGTGYNIYETVSNIIDSLATIFPWFMYFVAALVTLTTMTRFVDEERINMGTLKALGYSDIDIIKKFVIYGFIASMVGTIIGVTLGHILIPYIVYGAYENGFSIPKIELHFYLKETIIAFILSLLCSVVPAIIVAKNNLKDKPANLLLPKAPASGSKILLERIKFIWKRLNFTKKVTARNIFRYKKRMFMTIFGVAGACSLIFTGFSVQHSISTINDKQFNEIIKYDMIVALNNELSEKEETEFNQLASSDKVNSKLNIYYEEVSKIAGKKNDEQEINLIVTDNLDEFSKFINLRDRKSKENISITDDGVVISERLATLQNLEVGDEFTYQDSNGEDRTVKISGICEMYAGHFMFMSKDEYKKIYNNDYKKNAYMFMLKDKNISNVEEISSEFMKLSSVKGTLQNTTLYNQINTIVHSLNKIMIVLIIISSLLAIVILFNLTNINVEERIRELSTIKVLGFLDNEVTMYIYRETIILSQLGIIGGWLFGLFLHNYILTVVPPEQIMFDPSVWINAYVISFVVINIVTIILKFYVNKKLINVDMIEALKSVD